jgi:GT2 family glycosyltransferase
MSPETSAFPMNDPAIVGGEGSKDSLNPLVVVVIVVWNGITDTLECLRSLEVDEYPNKQILVVDNGSTDGSADRLHAEGFNVSVITCPTNLGFTGGNNVGLAEALRRGAQYAFLLNNDTTLEADALTRLVEAAEVDTGIGLLSPVVHYYDAPGEVWFSGAKICMRRGEALHTDAPSDIGLPGFRRGISHKSQIYPSEWVSGCAMLVRMKAVAVVGGFDDRFFLTWEDVDWCVRMSRQNWRVSVVRDARIYHKCGRSGARLAGIHRYYAVRNSLLFVAKHSGPFYLSAFIFIMGRHLRGAIRSRGEQRVQSIRTVFEGLKDHLLGRYGRRPQQSQAGGEAVPGGAVGAGKIGGSACVLSK